MNFKEMIQNTLDKLNLLDSEQKLSLSNITVAIFVIICAFRMLFGGSTINIGTFKWSIQVIDTAGTLPVLFGLLNYANKRMVINKASNDEKDKK